MVDSRNRNRCRIQRQICSQQLIRRTKHRDCILRSNFGSAHLIRFNSGNEANALAGCLKIAIDTKMVAAERARSNNSYAQLAFVCDLLCPFAFDRLEAPAVEVQQMIHVVFGLRR